MNRTETKDCEKQRDEEEEAKDQAKERNGALGKDQSPVPGDVRQMK